MFQNEVLNELVTKYREKKLAHAYLIETNNIEKAVEDIKELVKIINCSNIYAKNCNLCNLCNLISKDNLPSLKIISKDGTSIKKSQIETLKIDFGSIPIYSKYNIYIIKNAESLNISSANAMLKFVEEPTERIIGFFLTNNKDIMIETIKSRCQSIILNYPENSFLESLNITKEEYETYEKTIEKYLNKINSNNIINHKKEILAEYNERSEIELIFKIIFNIYYQNFLKKIGSNYDDTVTNKFKLVETQEALINKLNIISETLREISYNVNIELLLDKFVIEMRGTNE